MDRLRGPASIARHVLSQMPDGAANTMFDHEEHEGHEDQLGVRVSLDR